MKKLFSIVTMVALVFFLSPNAASLDQGEVELDLQVGSFAMLEIVDYETTGDLIDFGELEGEAGVYYIDGEGFEETPGGLPSAYTDGESWSDLDPEQVEGHGHGGYFKVKTNKNVDIDFDWEPDEDLVSPMFFALFCPEETEYVHKFGSGDLEDSEGNEIHSDTSYSQSAGTNQEWHIDAAIYITEVHEQEAGEYTGTINVTIVSS